MSDLLTVHKDLLERRRRVLNLVGPGPLEPHYRDADESLADLDPSGHWADLGSGAGFPGIPFAARFPDVALDLVEIREKRCTFLEAVLADAHRILADRPAKIRVVRSRIEDLPEAAYDGVLARALAPSHEVLALAARVVRPGGLAVLLVATDKTRIGGEGWEFVKERRYQIDGSPRRSVVLRRVAS